MGVKTESDTGQHQRLEDTKKLASRIMHMHYCEYDIEGIASCFSEQFSWVEAGEQEYLSGRKACADHFRKFRESMPDCSIWDEEYDVVCPMESVHVVMGRMWIATDPGTRIYLKVHQRVTFVFRDTEDGLTCSHIHCSNPYQGMLGGENFLEKIGRQSYEYVQERLNALGGKTRQQNRQLEVIMSSIAGGLKISNDDETYSFAFVNKEAAALSGYTVEELMEVTGGTAVGNVYPSDLPGALADRAKAFRDGNLTYSTRYRVCCKDGSLEWVIDSGKKAQDADGNWMVNSLYLDVTRSEEDAQCLRKQTQLLTSIYDTVPCDIIRFVRDIEGGYRLVPINRAVLNLMGYRDMEEGLNDWHDGVPGAVLEEDHLILQKAYRKLREIGDRQDQEYRVGWKDGSIHWLERTSMVVGVTPRGEDILQHTAVNITQRKILQEQLEREQEMYRVSMEVSSTAMFEYRMDKDVFISYEPKTGQGVLRNELRDYSRTLLKRQVVHPDDVPTVIDNICNGRSEVFRVRVSVPGGEPGTYTQHRANSRLMMGNGKPSRVVGALRSIHSMKPKLLENSERLYMSQSMLQAINGVYMSILYVNLPEDSYYAVKLPEVRGGAVLSKNRCYSTELCSYILSDVDQADRKRVMSICKREWLLGEPVRGSEHIEVEFRHGFSPLWPRLEIHMVASKESRPRTAIIALRNISAEKQRELKYYDEEKKAGHVLEGAYDSPNRANQVRSDSLSRMSHDIRTPMNAIMDTTAIAQSNLNNRDEIEDCLSKISLSGSHLLDLINKVLDMSKIESGNVGLSEDTFCLEELVEEVSLIVKPDMDSKGQELSISLKEIDHHAVCGDAVRAKQILINLLSNAVKYTSDRGHIAVSLEEKLSSESKVGCFEFVVEDDGIGMAPEFLEKLLMPFERAEDSRVNQVQGTGLGLAIIRNLVQMINGIMRVESQLNRGAQFITTIYLKLAGEEDTEERSQNGDTPRTPASFPPGACVLLAEGNELNREIAAELLSMFSITAVCAVNGREAMERFEADPPGTYAPIPTDIQMLVMNGYTATSAIRSLGKTDRRPDGTGIPIIALTANAFADDVYRIKQAGMDEHVTKPLEISRLLEIMHRYLDVPARNRTE